MHCSVAQAVAVWAELERALRGEAAFGSDTSEIYAYTLSPLVPTVHLHRGGNPFGRDGAALARQVADSLRALLELFEAEHECRAFVDEVPLREWTDGLVHRVHVRIEPRGETP